MGEKFSVRARRKLRLTASATALWHVDKLGYRLGLRSADGLTLPDFMGIGAQKAGTSWLWANLRCHPELYLPERKELHYFDQHFYQGLAHYASRFAEGNGKVKGEITPAYGVLPPQTIAFIKKLMPELKVILILRNPVDRAWSRAKMVLRDPGSDRVDLAKFSPREIHRAIAHRSSQARGEYLAIIDNWRQHFRPEQFYICFYEDLAEKPGEFLEGIFSFLGVTSDVDWSQFPSRTVIGRGAKATIPDEYRQLLEDMYRTQIEALYQRFGSRVQSWRCV